MLNGMIKSNIFISLAKRTVFARAKEKSWKKVMFTKLCFRFLSRKRVLQSLHQNYLRNCLDTTLKFILNFFCWEFSCKSRVYVPNLAYSNIFHKSIIILISRFYICIPCRVRFFINIPSLANLNSQSKYCNKRILEI